MWASGSANAEGVAEIVGEKRSELHCNGSIMYFVVCWIAYCKPAYRQYGLSWVLCLGAEFDAK